MTVPELAKADQNSDCRVKAFWLMAFGGKGKLAVSHQDASPPRKSYKMPPCKLNEKRQKKS